MNGDTESYLKTIQALVDIFGPTYTFIIIIAFIVCSSFFKFRQSKKWSLEVRELINEKEKSMQRLANEVRTWKTLYFKEAKNWTNDEIERFMITRDFETGPEARQAMEDKRKKEE